MILRELGDRQFFMFKAFIFSLPFFYVIRRQYFTINSLVKFLVLELLFYFIFSLSSFGETLLVLIMFYSIYEIGYWQNDRFDVHVSTRTIPDSVLRFFPYLIPFRLLIFVSIGTYLSDTLFISSTYALILLISIVFCAFNMMSSFQLRGLLLSILTFLKIIILLCFQINMELFSDILIIFVSILPFIFQKIWQYSYHKKITIHYVDTPTLFFVSFAAIVTMVVFDGNILLSSYLSFVALIYHFLYIRLIK